MLVPPLLASEPEPSSSHPVPSSSGNSMRNQALVEVAGFYLCIHSWWMRTATAHHERRRKPLGGPGPTCAVLDFDERVFCRQKGIQASQPSPESAFFLSS